MQVGGVDMDKDGDDAGSARLFPFFLGWWILYFVFYNASRRTNFARWEFKPKPASLILYALSCRFFGCNLLVCVFLAFRICLCFVQFKSPPQDFLKQGQARYWQRQVRGLLTARGLLTLSAKSPQALCTNKAILCFHFLDITNLLGLLNHNRQNQLDRACRIELADLGLNFRKIGPAPRVIIPIYGDSNYNWWTKLRVKNKKTKKKGILCLRACGQRPSKELV